MLNKYNWYDLTHVRTFGAQVQKMFLPKHVWALTAPLHHLLQSYANVGLWCTTCENRTNFCAWENCFQLLKNLAKGCASGRLMCNIIKLPKLWTFDVVPNL